MALCQLRGVCVLRNTLKLKIINKQATRQRTWTEGRNTNSNCRMSCGPSPLPGNLALAECWRGWGEGSGHPAVVTWHQLYASPAQRDPTDGPAPHSCPTPVTIASLIYALNGTGRRLSF